MSNNPQGDQKVLNHVLLDDNDVHGVEVVNDSFSETRDGRTIKDSWREKLRIHQRLQPFHGKQPPTIAFSHLVFGDHTAAVLRRVHQDGDAGRNLTHALVGAAGPLAGIALQLTRWNGWRDRTEKHQSIAPDLLVNIQPLGHQQNDRLRFSAMKEDIKLARLLAAVLECPELPNTFSVIGVPDQHVVPMLWGIRDIVRAIAAGIDWDRWWSFSTYETSDAHRENLPEFVFLPAYPSDIQAQAHRHRVDYTPDALSVDRGYLDLAAALMLRYQSSGPEEIRRITRNAPDLATRIRALALDLVGTDLRPRDMTKLVNATATTPAVEEDTSVTAPEQPTRTSDVPAADLARSGLLDQLTAARTAEDLAQLTRQIRTGSAGTRLAENGQLIAWRALVDQRVIDILRTELPVQQQIAEFATVLDFVFGVPGSMSVAGSVTQPVLDWLARADVPRIFVQLVYERVCGASLGEVGKQALGDRWLAEQRQLPPPPVALPPAPAPVPTPAPVPAPPVPEDTRSKRLSARIHQTAIQIPWWYLVVVSLLILLLILIGVVV